MKSIAIVIALLVAVSFPASANPGPSGVLWFDDMESGEGEWTHVDLTASVSPHFHLDTYLAYDDPAFGEDSSWWCGTFDYDADGGYGNGWDDLLNVPTIEVGPVAVEEMTWGGVKSLYLTSNPTERESGEARSVLPVLTFAYRYDSEPYYDYTYVQVDSFGTWVTLNGDGWDGSSGGWQDLGPDGYVLDRFGTVLNIRFRFVSDGAMSDEDGDYLSDGGAFHVDNITVYDFNSGMVLFEEDCQSGGLCLPSVPEPAGDWWDIVDRKCPAYSDPHCWWCGDDADTGLIPPNLANALITPAVDITGCNWCTLRSLVHYEIPTVDNDYWTLSITTDGGVTWHSLGGWWGDFEQCDGWASSGLYGHDISPFLPGTSFQARFTMYSTDNGCGPGAAGGAGLYVDDTWLEAYGKSGVGSLPSPPKVDRRYLIPDMPHRF